MMEFNNKEKQSHFFEKVKENLMVGNDLRYLLSGCKKDEIAEELIPSYIKEMYPLVRALR